MKVSKSVSSLLIVLVAASQYPQGVQAFSPNSILPSTRSGIQTRNPNNGNNSAATKKRSRSQLNYDIQREPSGENLWQVLTTTERWIASTLQNAAGPNGNPISRKEVSYVCETSEDPAMILANIFRKLKEARQLGETHAQEQEELSGLQEGNHSPVTLRQTQVMVIPSSEDMADYHVFNNLVAAINSARRSARDYVTGHSLKKLNERLQGGEDRDWSVSVNCAHLHPHFGEKTAEERLKELQQEEEEGEVDLNMKEYMKKRTEARQSPYPSIVVEVRAMPPPEFTPPPPHGPSTPPPLGEINEPVTSDVVNQLESLFAKSSLQKDGGFYESIGTHIEEVDSMNPLTQAQNWVAGHDPMFDASACAFTTSDTPHVDESYEFLFTNLAMQTSQFLNPWTSIDAGAQKRQYLVMTKFVTSSATSMEKFCNEANNMIQAIPSIRRRVSISWFHPEHVDKSKRCPVPVFVLQWQD